MENPHPSETSRTLLEVLRSDPTNPAAWQEFVERYGPSIYQWCSGHLQEADAQDVTQSLLICIPQKMRTFEYDPQKGSFRGWLYIVTRRAWLDFVEVRKKRGADFAAGDNQILAWIEHASPDELGQALKPKFDHEIYLLASARVQLEVSRRDWEIHLRMETQGQSGKEVAAELDMSRAAVYMARKRVRDELKRKIAQLEGDQD